MLSKQDKVFLAHLAIAKARMKYVADRLATAPTDTQDDLAEHYSQEFERLIGETELLNLKAEIGSAGQQ